MRRTVLLLASCAYVASCGSSSQETEPVDLSGRVLFGRDVPPYGGAIYSMTKAGADVRLLKRVDSLYLTMPRVSPAGDRIAMLGGLAMQPLNTLFMMAADGRDLHPVPLPVAFGGFSWSPDGQKIVFGCTALPPPAGEAAEGICVVGADGSGFAHLTHLSTPSRAPTWSPDGTRIAFVGDSAGGEWELFWIPATGGAATQITHNLYPDWDPAWSPDGSLLAFVSQRPAAGGEIYTIAPDGSAEQRITFLGATCPSWAPDSQRIWFCSSGQVYAVHRDGVDPHPVTNAPEHSGWPFEAP